MNDDDLKKVIRDAFDILTNIPEDLNDWEETNAAIQEAHDILDDAMANWKTFILVENLPND